MRTIRVSEIGEYHYCRRAWGYRLQGQPSANRPLLIQGTQAHRRHGRLGWRALLLRGLGYGLLLLAAILLAVGLALRLSGGPP